MKYHEFWRQIDLALLDDPEGKIERSGNPMGFGIRQLTSNDPPRSTERNPWLHETNTMDAQAMLINGLAKRCSGCNRPTEKKYLDKSNCCPDCRPQDAM